MKKWALIALLTLVILPSTLNAASKGGKGDYEENYSNSLEVAVLPVFWANLDVRYDYAFSDIFSAFGNLGFAPAGSNLLFSETDSDYWKYSFAHAAVGICVYPTAPSRGLYFQLSGDGYRFNVKNKTEDLEASFTRYMAPAMMIGWKWIISDRAVIRLGGGSGFGSGGAMVVGDSAMEWKEVQSRFDLNLGFLF